MLTLPRKYHHMRYLHFVQSSKRVDPWTRRFMCVSATRVLENIMRGGSSGGNRVDYSPAKLASQSFMGMPTDYNVHSLIGALRDNFVWIVLSDPRCRSIFIIIEFERCYNE